MSLIRPLELFLLTSLFLPNISTAMVTFSQTRAVWNITVTTYPQWIAMHYNADSLKLNICFSQSMSVKFYNRFLICSCITTEQLQNCRWDCVCQELPRHPVHSVLRGDQLKCKKTCTTRVRLINWNLRFSIAGVFIAYFSYSPQTVFFSQLSPFCQCTVC